MNSLSLAGSCLVESCLVEYWAGELCGRAGGRASGFRRLKSCFIGERCIDFASALGENVDKRTLVRLSNVNKSAVKRRRILTQQVDNPVGEEPV
jgi:hypothetical protein